MMPVTRHLHSIMPSCQRNERIVRRMVTNHHFNTESYKRQENGEVMRVSPFTARSDIVTFNVQSPLSPTSAIDDESLVVHPITPDNLQAAITSADDRSYDHDDGQREEDTRDAALLLTNVGILMAKEVNGSLLKEKNAPILPDLHTPSQGSYLRSDSSSGSSIGNQLNWANLCSHSTRARAVSMDSHIHILDSSVPLQTPTLCNNHNIHDQDNEKHFINISQPTNGPPISTTTIMPRVSPPTFPMIRTVSQDEDFAMISMTKVEGTVGKNTSARHVDRRKRYLDSSSSSSEEGNIDHNDANTDKQILGGRKRSQDGRFAQDRDKPKLLNYHNHNTAKSGSSLKFILRKKFSWKNYPVLEAFLIANRGEYLRHSALNYTMQQKNYNNRLTERLLELASENGYIFDEEAFSFVTVRDRIRCYFKSYVQSRKKRGVIIGYAARRAGLMSEKEIEASAGRKGRIVVPQCFTGQQQQRN